MARRRSNTWLNGTGMIVATMLLLGGSGALAADGHDRGYSLTLAQDGKSPCRVVMARNAAPQVRAAAGDLVAFFLQMTGAELVHAEVGFALPGWPASPAAGGGGVLPDQSACDGRSVMWGRTKFVGSTELGGAKEGYEGSDPHKAPAPPGGGWTGDFSDSLRSNQAAENR